MAEMKIGEKTQGPIQGQLHSDGAHNELDRVEGELKKKDPAIVTAQASTSAPEAPAAATQTPYPMDNKSFDFEFWKESERGFKPETKLDKFLSNPSPENLKGATQEVFDPNGDGKVSLQEAKEYVGKIKAMGTASVTALSKMSNEELQDIIKREGSDGKELASSMKKSGLEISQEAALEIQKGLVGIAKEALATKKASNLDLDGNKEVDKAEAEKSADSLKVAVSKFPLQAKQAILKNDEILSKEDPTGQKEADEYTKNTGIKMTAEAALVIREAKKAGAA